MASETASDGAPKPASTLERELAAIWSEVLDVSDVGSDTAFVELGGDSIAATLCLNRIQKVLGRHITLEAMLDEDMTLRRLAEIVRGTDGAETANP